MGHQRIARPRIARPRITRPRHKWPICPHSGKRRFGERKDARLALRSAQHIRAIAALDGKQSSFTVCRAYHCAYCGGWHLTSLPLWN